MIAAPHASHRAWKPDQEKKPIAVMMSGGVDSSTTAWLLKKQGWDVVGVTMLVPSACGGESACCGAHAADVCAELGVPHYLFDTFGCFYDRVIEPFRAAYAAGRTPSPCIDCNTAVKFDALARAIREHLGIEALATGHYAKIEREDGQTYLARAMEREKDQSYFLYGIPAEVLPRVHFPLGGETKDRVRELARESGIHVADKPDSQDLCFAGEADYRAALDARGSVPGPIVNLEGVELGTHRGISHYTIGQRHGLDLGHHLPHFVLAIDVPGNRLVVGPRAAAYQACVSLERLNILQPLVFAAGLACGVKLRSGGDPAPCTVETIDTTGRCTIRCQEPAFAPTPGQHGVLYDAADRVIAGGVIEGKARR